MSLPTWKEFRTSFVFKLPWIFTINQLMIWVNLLHRCLLQMLETKWGGYNFMLSTDWPFSSPTASNFLQKCRAPIFYRCQNRRNSSTWSHPHPHVTDMYNADMYNAELIFWMTISSTKAYVYKYNCNFGLAAKSSC